MPSGNSVAANALLRLYHLTQTREFLTISTKIMESFGTMAAENPFGFGYLLNTIYLYLQTPTEITVLGDDKTIYDLVTKRFLPESILVVVRNEDSLQPLSKYAFFAGKEFQKHTSVFVCKNFSCSLPLTTIPEIERLLFEDIHF
jgi:uncharacterized protein